MTTPTQPRFREPRFGEFSAYWVCWARGHRWLSPQPVCPNKGELRDTVTGNTVCGRCAAEILGHREPWWKRIPNIFEIRRSK